MQFVDTKILPLIEKHKLLFKIFSIIVFIIVGFVTYHNIFDNSFHFDDSVWRQLDQVQNYDYKGLLDFNIFRIIPFATFIHNYHHFGEETAGYYYINLAIHIFNTIFVFSLLLMIFKVPALKDKEISRYASIIAFFGALIFLTHPIQTQAVAYIYQRLASMAAFFYLSSCVLYLSFRISKSLSKKIIYFILLIIAFIMGLFSKENTFTLPVTLAVFELFLMHKNIKIRPVSIILTIILIIALVFLADLLLGFEIIFSPQKSPYDDIITSDNYLLTQFRVISTYWRLLFLPYGQHLDYYFPLSESFFETWTFLGFLFNLLIIGIGLITLKKHPLISIGIFWFYITLLIESSVIPIKDVIFEHRLYLPMFGFILIIMYLMFEFVNKKYILYIIIFLISVNSLYSYLSYQRNRVWQNDGTLWTDTIRKSPQNSRAWNNRGLYFLKNNKYEIAIKNFSQAINLKPQYTEPYSNRGTAYFYIGQYQKSLQDMNKSIELDPNIPDIYMNRSNVHMILNDFESAIKDLNILLKKKPNEPHAYMGLARCYRELKNWKKAIMNYEKYLEFEPNSVPSYINLAICYVYVDSTDKAITTIERGLKANPNDPKLLSRKTELLQMIRNK
jgi:tetratricopeptide (TPR) repeat protein